MINYKPLDWNFNVQRASEAESPTLLFNFNVFKQGNKLAYILRSITKFYALETQSTSFISLVVFALIMAWKIAFNYS